MSGEMQHVSLCLLCQEMMESRVWPLQLSPQHYEHEQQIHQLLLHAFIL